MDYSFLHFGIAKHLSEKEYQLFGIIDSEEAINNFFQNQKIVKFSKLWYLYEHISLKKPDVDYLRTIEEKYHLNIWSIAYTDRYFYNKFNRFHNFQHDEILSLLEQECRLFEKIISETKPDYIITNTITHHYQYLFYKMCTTKEIPVLTLEPLRFANRWIVTNGTMYDLDHTTFLKNFQNQANYTNDEINQLAKSTGKIQIEKKLSPKKISLHYKIKAIFNFLFFPRNLESSKRFSSYGRNRKNILLKGTARIFILKKKLRESFLKHNSFLSIPENIPFVYYPLHLDPERVLLMGAPYYVDQIGVITNIAKSLPVGLKLYVKEHPNMKDQGWREKSFYKQILELPNVELIHPNVPSEELLDKCKLVITIRGTTSLEAIQHGKPSIVFKADIGHSMLPSIHILKNIEELPIAILQSLKKKTSSSEISKYLDFIENNSFEFDSVDYSQNVAKRFNYSVGYLQQVRISEDQMKSFLKDFSLQYKTLGEQYEDNIHKFAKTK